MLTQKQEEFILDVLSNVTPSKAYFTHYKCKPSAACALASRLLTKANIQARIKELRAIKLQEILKETVAQKLEAGQVATQILRARFSDFDIDNLTKEQLSSPAIRQITRQGGTGRDGKSPWNSTTVKLESPLAAAEYLAKLYGWYETLPEGFQDNRVINFIISGEEAKGLVEGVRKRLGEGGKAYE